MEKHKKIVIWLVVVLLLSNLIWAASYFLQIIGCGYNVSRLRGYENSSKQLMALLPIIAQGNVTRQQISAVRNRDISYETVDTIVIGGDIGFRFDKKGHLLEFKIASVSDSFNAKPDATVPQQVLSYSIYSLSPIFGEQEKIAEGVRTYKPEDILITPDHLSPFVKNWSKSLELSNGFWIGAEVYREPKIAGFGLWIKLNDEDFSWEWFEQENNEIYRKRQGKGRVKVLINSIGNDVQLKSIEFLDDVTLRLQADRWTWWRSIPFLKRDTHIVIVKKGSKFWLGS